MGVNPSASMRRRCSGTNIDGAPCGAPPLLDDSFCLMHSPERADAVKEGRKMGGMRRHRESTLQAVYDFEGLHDGAAIRRLLQIAALDALGLENSIARVRALSYVASVALRALEITDLEKRLVAVERLLEKRSGN